MNIGTFLRYLTITTLFGTFIIVVVFMVKKNTESPVVKNDTKSLYKPNNKHIVFEPNKPKNFSVGPIITNEPYKSSNLCDSTKLFPTKNVYVEYDKAGEIPDNAKCLEYIQAP